MTTLPGPAVVNAADSIGQALQPPFWHRRRLLHAAGERNLAAGARAADELAKMRAAPLEVNPDAGRAKVKIVGIGEVMEEHGFPQRRPGRTRSTVAPFVVRTTVEPSSPRRLLEQFM